MDEPGTSPSPAIELLDRTSRLSIQGFSWLRDAAARTLAPLCLRGEVRVAVIGDAEMAHNHKEFCGIPGTTDVLTFDCSEPADGPTTLIDADILVCIDEAERQAIARGHAPERELLLYIVHGVLHCLGYDDHEEEAATTMHRREDELLEAAGIGATYASGPAREGSS